MIHVFVVHTLLLLLLLMMLFLQKPASPTQALFFLLIRCVYVCVSFLFCCVVFVFVFGFELYQLFVPAVCATGGNEWKCLIVCSL